MLTEGEVCCFFFVFFYVYPSPLPALLCSVLFGHYVLFHCESSSYLFTVVVCHYWGSAALHIPVLSLARGC